MIGRATFFPTGARILYKCNNVNLEVSYVLHVVPGGVS
jgi:hypothetical protein